MNDLLERYTPIPASELIVRAERGRVYINFQTFTEDIVLAMERDQAFDLIQLLQDAVGTLDH